jgi:hypothetical protein
MVDQPDMSRLSGELYRQWEQAVGDWWDKTLQTPAFLNAMGDSLGAQTRMRRDWETRVDETLTSMHLPSRQDVVRVTRVATLLEDKLLGLEDRLLALEDRLTAIERETLKARVEAAEARVFAQERLAGLEAKIDALAAAWSARAPEDASASRGPRGGRKGS